MTQEEKQLLFRDLSARLQYGVNANISLNTEDDCLNSYPIVGIVGMKIVSETDVMPFSTSIESVKPYLRPMSSMTEEEEIYYNTVYTTLKFYQKVDWLNEHHFDYRGLIPMGLALEAPEDMYKTDVI